LENSIFLIALLLIAIVLVFEFSNGFNDCANIVVSSVVTGALERGRALFIVALFEFIGAWFLGTAVAETLGKGIVSPDHITVSSIFAALFGAIAWNFLAFFFGMPSSSSHALIGGLIGAVFVDTGPEWIHWKKVGEVLGILLLTPLVGLIAGRLLTQKVQNLLGDLKPNRANRLLKRCQILTSITLALSHGSNDAQKGMGMISLALILFHKSSPTMMDKLYQPMPDYAFYVPPWVILACSLALAFGVSVGGWRIMKTLGTKLYKIRPIHGFSAQLSSSVVIYLSSFIGFPVSTTQIVSSSILGAGSAKTLGSVRWGVGRQIFLTWVITIPGSAALSALFSMLLRKWS
jgi:inorganic phosphate transporter, PiT family